MLNIIMAITIILVVIGFTILSYQQSENIKCFLIKTLSETKANLNGQLAAIHMEVDDVEEDQTKLLNSIEKSTTNLEEQHKPILDKLNVLEDLLEIQTAELRIMSDKQGNGNATNTKLDSFMTTLQTIDSNTQNIKDLDRVSTELNAIEPILNNLTLDLSNLKMQLLKISEIDSATKSIRETTKRWTDDSNSIKSSMNSINEKLSDASLRDTITKSFNETVVGKLNEQMQSLTDSYRKLETMHETLTARTDELLINKANVADLSTSMSTLSKSIGAFNPKVAEASTAQSNLIQQHNEHLLVMKSAIDELAKEYKILLSSLASNGTNNKSSKNTKAIEGNASDMPTTINESNTASNRDDAVNSSNVETETATVTKPKRNNK